MSTSSRWCPTPEQVMLLEGMYRGGLKTPTSSQIQQITAHLSLYGKIEGKNVFYWFQNHKARDRQKLRRKLQTYHRLQLSHHHIPPAFLHHGGGLEDTTVQGMTYNWNVDLVPESCKMLSNCTMMDVCTTPCCRRPLKTLQLFPIKNTSTSLIDQLTTKP